MGKKKVTTTQQQTNTYGWQTPPETPAVTELQGMVQKGSDQSIPYYFAGQKENLDNSYNNPLGAYTTSAVRDASKRATDQSFGVHQAEAIKASNFQAGSNAFNQQAAVAGMTAPQLVQTGGTGSGTQTQTGGFWSGLLMNAIGAGAQVGAASF